MKKKKVFNHKLRNGINPIPSKQIGLRNAKYKYTLTIDIGRLQMIADSINKDKHAIDPEFEGFINRKHGERGNKQIFKYLESFGNTLYLPVYYAKDHIIRSKYNNNIIANREKGELSHYITVPLRQIIQED